MHHMFKREYFWIFFFCIYFKIKILGEFRAVATAELGSQAASQAGSQEKSQSQLAGLAFFSKLYEMKTNQIERVIF